MEFKTTIASKYQLRGKAEVSTLKYRFGYHVTKDARKSLSAQTSNTNRK